MLRHDPPLRRRRDRAAVGHALGGRRPLPGRRRPRTIPARASTRSTCSRTPRATCTWATPRRSAAATRWRGTRRCAATTSCTRSAGTRSACTPRTPRSSAASHPKDWTYANIDQQAASFRRMGMSFDWSRRLHTCDPEYYRWTQWLFLRFFERGLAYRKNAPVNWCPNDQTVLANEQVIQGDVRALRHAGRAPRPHAVVLQDHRLRAAAARRHGRS